MLFLNLKIAWRRLFKNKIYTLINVFGLSIGLSGCMLLFVYINYNLGFDREYPDSDRIYRFVTNWKYPSYDDYSKGVPVPMLEAAKNEFSGIGKAGVVIKRGGVSTYAMLLEGKGQEAGKRSITLSLNFSR